MNFNSIKVRLELSYTVASGATAQIFQFHKGTIRTAGLYAVQSAVPTFQFHKGTIRTHILPSYTELDANFNSIKVRLELSFLLI